jgi:hypothetical protein
MCLLAWNDIAISTAHVRHADAPPLCPPAASLRFQPGECILGLGERGAEGLGDVRRFFAAAEREVRRQVLRDRFWIEQVRDVRLGQRPLTN